MRLSLDSDSTSRGHPPVLTPFLPIFSSTLSGFRLSTRMFYNSLREDALVDKSMLQEMISKAELQFDLANISKEVEQVSKYVENRFSDKIMIISELIKCQTLLIGIYTNQINARVSAGSKYEHNIILTNTLLNFPYRALSTLLLVRNTFYGSARIICRQLLESMIIAKYSQYDRTLVHRWGAQHDKDLRRNRSTEISLGRDVFRNLEIVGKGILELRRTWKDLCNATHATGFSQQRLRVPLVTEGEEVNKWLRGTYFFENTDYTLDLLLALLAMNFHLIVGHYSRKAYRWYLGYLQDPLGSYVREKKLKDNCRNLFKEYFGLQGNRPSAKILWKRNIFQFKQSWGSLGRYSTEGKNRVAGL
jgi:hypothetical protein